MSQQSSNPYYLGRPRSISSHGSLYVEVRSTEGLNAGNLSLIRVGKMANKASYTTKYAQKDGTHASVFTIEVRITAKSTNEEVSKYYLVREIDFCDNFQNKYHWFNVHGECLQAYRQAKKDSKFGKGGHWLKKNIKPFTGPTNTPTSTTTQSSSSSGSLLNPSSPNLPPTIQPLSSGTKSKATLPNSNTTTSIQRSSSSGLNKRPSNKVVPEKQQELQPVTTVPNTPDPKNPSKQPVAFGTPDSQTNIETQSPSQTFSPYLVTGSRTATVPQSPLPRPQINKAQGSSGSKASKGIMNYVEVYLFFYLTCIGNSRYCRWLSYTYYLCKYMYV